MEHLQSEELSLRVEDPALGNIRVHLTGKSTSRHPGEVLVPFFTRVISNAAQGGHAVQVHCERLEHFNSSTIAALIQVINVSLDRSVSLTLIYDGALKWQALSFEALNRAVKPFTSGKTATVQFFSTAQR